MTRKSVKSRKFLQGVYTPHAGYDSEPSPFNGPVRYVCIVCQKNYIEAHTRPKHCDDCLDLEAAKAIVRRLRVKK